MVKDVTILNVITLIYIRIQFRGNNIENLALCSIEDVDII